MKSAVKPQKVVGGKFLIGYLSITDERIKVARHTFGWLAIAVLGYDTRICCILCTRV